MADVIIKEVLQLFLRIAGNSAVLRIKGYVVDIVEGGKYAYFRKTGDTGDKDKAEFYSITFNSKEER